MEEKESDLSCGMKSSRSTSVDISYTSSCGTYVLHNRVLTSNKVLGHVYDIYVISNYFEQLEEQREAVVARKICTHSHHASEL